MANKKNKKRLFEEIAIGIVGVVVLLGVISAVASWGHSAIYDTSKLPQGIIYVRYAEINPEGKLVRYWITWWHVEDIATLSGDKIVISVPEGNLHMFTRSAGYINAHKNDTFYVDAVRIDTGINWGELASHGFNKYEVYFKTDTNYTKLALARGWNPVVELNASKGSGYVDPSSIVTVAYMAGTAPVSIVYKPTYQAGLKTVDLTLGLKLYGSKAPVLEGIVKPIYSIFAGFIAAVLAAISKLRRISIHAVGGFSFSSLLSGLVGNPIIAAVIAIAVIGIAYYALHKPSPKRRKA